MKVMNDVAEHSLINNQRWFSCEFPIICKRHTSYHTLSFR